MNPLPLLRFFLRVPSLVFRFAGLVRVTNRARRRFKKALRAEGLPEDVADELAREFAPKMFGL